MLTLTLRANRYSRPFPWHTLKTVLECLAIFVCAVAFAYIGMAI